MKQKIFYALLATLTLAIVNLASAVADEASDARIAHAKTAAPSFISDEATIMETDGTILQQGSNGWTCMPDMMPGDGAPMCNDALWMEMLGAFTSKAEFQATGFGVSYMLQGDYGAGVSNSDPYHPDRKNADDYVETGPHLMVIVPREQLKGITDDPNVGGPYVMWKDTPYAHIMVPVAGNR